MYIGAAVCLWLLRAWKIGQLEELAAAAQKPTESVDPVTGFLSEGAIEPRLAEGGARSGFVRRMMRWHKV